MVYNNIQRMGSIIGYYRHFCLDVRHDFIVVLLLLSWIGHRLESSIFNSHLKLKAIICSYIFTITLSM